MENQSPIKLPDGVPSFMHIHQNDFRVPKPKKLKDDDVPICNCKYRADEPESACGERCLNVLTSTECTPGYCPCNIFCKNQKFQRRDYVKTKLFETEGRGWGLLADEDIQAGYFIIEYCGEVISSQEARHRSQTYEAQGFKDAYIISLNSNNYIDATKKGSLARFINHSCQPNCETRKWNVSGETRVGIFAKVNICAGTELTYDYNFEWYGGAAVRCLCGAANCSKFLGARSQGFLEYNHVWEEGDDRYQVEEVPLYDSAEDEPFPQNPKSISPFNFESVGGAGSSIPVEGVTLKEVKPEAMENSSLNKQDIEQEFLQVSEMTPRLRSTSAGRNFNTGAGPSKNKTPQKGKQKKRSSKGSQSKTINFAEMFQSKEAQDEIRKYEGLKNQATSKLQSMYDEIRPVIEQHERDSQDSVPATVGQQWIGAQCNKYKADIDFNLSFIRNFLHAAQNGGAGMQAPQNAAAADAGIYAQIAGGGAGTSAQGGGAGMSAPGGAGMSAPGGAGSGVQDAAAGTGTSDVGAASNAGC